MDGLIAAPLAVQASQRDIKWADVRLHHDWKSSLMLTKYQGLRGIAAIFVVTSHIARAFTPTLLNPQVGENASATLFHLPFLRLPAQGPPWVAFFFILTGYVNSMRPIKQTRSGNTTAALQNLASSSLRRSARLVLPTTVATIASWVICQLGGFRLAKACEADWIKNTSPDPSGGVLTAVLALLQNIISTWTSGANQYDPVQWTMPFLLKASMLVYMVLLATVRAMPSYRMGVFFGMYGFSLLSGDGKFSFLASVHHTLTQFSDGRHECICWRLPCGAYAATLDC